MRQSIGSTNNSGPKMPHRAKTVQNQPTKTPPPVGKQIIKKTTFARATKNSR